MSVCFGFMIVCILGLIVTSFMQYRNKWVSRIQDEFIYEMYTKHLKVIDDVAEEGTFIGADFHNECDKRYKRCDTYATYGNMMKKFWIWDKDKFRIKN